jgi:hypothetical protein
MASPVITPVSLILTKAIFVTDCLANPVAGGKLQMTIRFPLPRPVGVATGRPDY